MGRFFFSRHQLGNFRWALFRNGLGAARRLFAGVKASTSEIDPKRTSQNIRIVCSYLFSFWITFAFKMHASLQARLVSE